MKKLNNEFLFYNWVKLILSVYNGDIYYEKFKNKHKKMNEKEALNILKNQIKLMKMRDSRYYNITINELINFTKMEQYL